MGLNGARRAVLPPHAHHLTTCYLLPTTTHYLLRTALAHHAHHLRHEGGDLGLARHAVAVAVHHREELIRLPSTLVRWYVYEILSS